MTDHTLQRNMFQSGAVSAGAAVAFGAIGAHELRKMLEPEEMLIFETGVRYQFFHALAILMLAFGLRKVRQKTARQVWQLMLVGTAIFSGSLYILATRNLTMGSSLLWVGGLTPIGGIMLIGGWALLAFKGYKLTDISDTRSRKLYTRQRTPGEHDRERPEAETHKAG
jgi:uncharacterized membrane protein YgdD (TMEM256/DUF423 family)